MGSQTKCDRCLNRRAIISENGYHLVCALSARAARDCISGKSDKFFSTMPDEIRDMARSIVEEAQQAKPVCTVDMGDVLSEEGDKLISAQKLTRFLIDKAHFFPAIVSNAIRCAPREEAVPAQCGEIIVVERTAVMPVQPPVASVDENGVPFIVRKERQIKKYYCPFCHNELRDGLVKFCDECGAQLKGEADGG